MVHMLPLHLAPIHLDQIRHPIALVWYQDSILTCLDLLYHDSGALCKLSETCSGIMMLFLPCLFSAYLLANHGAHQMEACAHGSSQKQ